MKYRFLLHLSASNNPVFANFKSKLSLPPRLPITTASDLILYSSLQASLLLYPFDLVTICGTCGIRLLNDSLVSQSDIHAYLSPWMSLMLLGKTACIQIGTLKLLKRSSFWPEHSIYKASIPALPNIESSWLFELYLMISRFSECQA